MSNTTTLSVPVTAEHKRFLNELVKNGKAANTAHAVRMAIDSYREENLIADIFQSEMDIKTGRVFQGDLKQIVKNYHQ